MSAPGDVLAVLRAVRDSVPADQLIAYCDAVATVAELAETTKLAREWIIEAGARTPTLPNSATLSKLNRALARAGGAA